MVHKQDENFWNVQLASNKQTVHHVRRRSSGCSCLLNCPSCDACVHTFECSCADYSIRGVLCSHIHSVNILYPKTTAADLKIPGTELETTSDSDIEKKRKELSNIIQQDKQLQLLALYWLCHWSQNLMCKARGDGVKRTRQYKLLMNAMIKYWVPVVILLL